MKVIDLRRHLPEPGTIIELEPGDIIRYPDGHNHKVKGAYCFQVISDAEAQAASDLCCDPA